MYWFNHKLRTVIALQAEGVLLGVFLWQHKGLLHFPFVKIRNVDAAEVAITPAAGAHNPMPVARPRRVTVGKTFAVQTIKR